jgi:hypothetical protein
LYDFLKIGTFFWEKRKTGTIFWENEKQVRFSGRYDFLEGQSTIFWKRYIFLESTIFWHSPKGRGASTDLRMRPLLEMIE